MSDLEPTPTPKENTSTTDGSNYCLTTERNQEASGAQRNPRDHKPYESGQIRNSSTLVTVTVDLEPISGTLGMRLDYTVCVFIHN